jgi:HPt (histidine-containing phosphotransfer) domain-containing protein
MSTDKEIIIDLTYLKEVATGDTEFIIEMIDIFLLQTPGYVEQLTAAVEQKDWTKIADLSHKIKPTFAFMGVESAKNSLQEIETKSRNQEDYDGIVLEYNKMIPVFKVIFLKLEDKKIELLAEG